MSPLSLCVTLRGVPVRLVPPPTPPSPPQTTTITTTPKVYLLKHSKKGYTYLWTPAPTANPPPPLPRTSSKHHSSSSPRDVIGCPFYSCHASCPMACLCYTSKRAPCCFCYWLCVGGWKKKHPVFDSWGGRTVCIVIRSLKVLCSLWRGV